MINMDYWIGQQNARYEAAKVKARWYVASRGVQAARKYVLAIDPAKRELWHNILLVAIISPSTPK